MRRQTLGVYLLLCVSESIRGNLNYSFDRNQVVIDVSHSCVAVAYFVKFSHTMNNESPLPSIQPNMITSKGWKDNEDGSRW